MSGARGQDLIQEKLTRFNQEAEERDAQRRAAKLNLPYLNLVTTPIEIDALKLIPEEEAKKIKIAAINLVGRNKLVAAVFDFDEEAKQEVKRLEEKGYEVQVFAVSLGGLRHAWSYYQYVSKETREIIEVINLGDLKKREGLSDIKSINKILGEINFREADINDIFDLIIAGGLIVGVSDIHFEPQGGRNVIRFRLDGVLHNVFDKIPDEIYKRIISKLKLLSELKINIHDRPQDGRFTIKAGEKDIEVRVAVAPSEFGETAVLRLLDPETISLTLANLGFLKEDLDIIKKQSKAPNGLILNTGPTGSGKTTTLYAFLKKIYNPEIKIITVEDPIEYHLEGIDQTQVDRDAGYDFGSGLRSILRQDPDVILVGEVRDLETAEMAVHASLTGHLVLSTLHTNSAGGAIPRLIDLGVKPQSIGPSLNLIIAQRLVRKLCDKCKEEEKVLDNLRGKIEKFLENLPKRIDKERFKNFKIFKKGKGCENCNMTGYKGRIGIFELLVVSDDIKELIHEGVSEVEIRKKALEEEMILMGQDGILKVLAGLTDFSEVERVAGSLEFFEK